MGETVLCLTLCAFDLFQKTLCLFFGDRVPMPIQRLTVLVSVHLKQRLITRDASDLPNQSMLRTGGKASPFLRAATSGLSTSRLRCVSSGGLKASSEH